LDWQTRRVLVTVKAYPRPSRKYIESVCTAGVDVDTGEWIRLYPIRFRDLSPKQQFRKYSVIEVRAQKAHDDNRPESYHVDGASIRVLDHWDTDKDRSWRRRNEVVLRQAATTLCALKERQTRDFSSLGIVKPVDVGFACEHIDPNVAEYRQLYYSQLDAFNAPKSPIEPIPYKFTYSFKCPETPDCRGHNLSVVDWELMQSYRKWRHLYADEATLMAKLAQRWIGQMCDTQRDTHFYVGNVFLHQRSFLVLGVFWPPKRQAASPA
jgi:hypothetical protein